MKRIIALPIEVKVREFDARILLCAYLLNEGFEVLIGPRGSIWNELKFLKNADIIYKSISKDIEKNLLDVQSRRGKVYILDEEGGLFSKNQDDVIKSIFPSNMTHCIDYYFVSGNKIKELVLHNLDEINENQMFVVGNPRFDFFKRKYKGFYDDSINEIKNKYGKFLIFNLNFSMGNPNRGWNEQIQYLDNHPDFKQSLIDDIKRKMNWQKGHIEEYVELIRLISNKYRDYNIIVRPHPSEDESFYMNKFNDLHNVYVKREGNVLPWIHASELSIHYDCTTGIETVLSGKPTISYTPNKDESLVNWLSPFVSDEVSSREEFFKTLSGYLSNDIKFKLSKTQSTVLNDYIANQTIDSAESVAKIVKSISSRESTRSERTIVRFLVRIRKRLGKIRRSLKKRDEYSHHFKSLKRDEVRQNIHHMLNTIGFDFDIEVKKHGLDTFLLKRKK